MKTFAALIRRYVLATAAIVLLVGGLLVGQIFYVGFKSNAVDATGYRVGALADALKQTETGLQWGREHTPAEWMQGYAWAMVLDDNGNVIWQQDLPQKLNHRYTASEVAVFSHWYLADYPVQCWAADYGLFVVAEPVGTCWKYNIDMKQKMIIMLAKSIQPTMVELLLVVLGCCLWFSWRGARHLQAVADGLDTLAQGGAVQLPTTGFAGELAEKLNPGSRLRATALGGGKTVLKTVGSIPGIRKVEIESEADGQVTFTAESADASDRRAEVSRALSQAGCTVLALAAENRTLEEVFLALTENESETPSDEGEEKTE